MPQVIGTTVGGILVAAVVISIWWRFVNPHLKKANQEATVFRDRSFHLIHLLMETLPRVRVVYTGVRVGDENRIFVFTFEGTEVELFLRLSFRDGTGNDEPKEDDVFSVRIESGRFVGSTTYWSLVDHSTHQNIIPTLVLTPA